MRGFSWGINVVPLADARKSIEGSGSSEIDWFTLFDISFSVVRFMLSVALFKAASVNHIDAVGVSSITAKIWAIIIII